MTFVLRLPTSSSSRSEITFQVWTEWRTLYLWSTQNNNVPDFSSFPCDSSWPDRSIPVDCAVTFELRVMVATTLANPERSWRVLFQSARPTMLNTSFRFWTLPINCSLIFVLLSLKVKEREHSIDKRQDWGRRISSPWNTITCGV